jgi:hypothetical protein
MVLVLRNPTSILHAEPLYEDGPVFIQGTFDVGGSLLKAYEGYLHVAPRLVALIATKFPPSWWPFVMNAAAILFTASVAAFIASSRLSVLGAPRVRLAIASGVVLLPAAHELSWHAVYIQWSLAVFLLLRVLADEPKRRLSVWADRLAVALAAVTGPCSVVFAPLYVWHKRGPVALIVVSGALVQIAFILNSERIPGSVQDLDSAVRLMATRLIVSPILGTHLSYWLGTVGIPAVVAAAAVLVFGALLVIASRALARPVLIAMLYSASSLATIGLVRSRDPVPQLLAAYDASRYFLLAGIAVMTIVVTAVIAGRGSQRVAAVLLAVPLVLGMVFDFNIPTNPSIDWETASTCIGGAEPCFIPDLGDNRWSVYWPGRP